MGLERFIADFYQTQRRFQNAEAALGAGDMNTARAAMTDCRPEQVVEQFAKLSPPGEVTRGEQGLVVSLNTRWLARYVRLRQCLGLEAVRYNFGPTSHDPLAQLPGRFTFYCDPGRHLWQTLGTKETGVQVFTLPPETNGGDEPKPPTIENEICQSGLESDRPVTITLRPILSTAGSDSSLPAGNYRLRLFLIDPAATAPGQRVFAIDVRPRQRPAAQAPKPTRTNPSPAPPSDRIDVFRETGRQRQPFHRDYALVLDRPGTVVITLTPVVGKAILCGALLEPGPISNN